MSRNRLFLFAFAFGFIGFAGQLSAQSRSSLANGPFQRAAEKSNQSLVAPTMQRVNDDAAIPQLELNPVFPNPSAEYAFVTGYFYGDFRDDYLLVAIIDLATGEMIDEQNVIIDSNEFEHRIDLTGLREGYYLLSYRTIDDRYAHRELLVVKSE